MRRRLVEVRHPELSLKQQLALLSISRSGYYYTPCSESDHDLLLKRLLDEQYTKTPFYGSRRMQFILAERGHCVGRRRIAALMQQMGLEAIYPKRSLSEAGPGHRIYPYLLRGRTIERVDQVWSCDITYIRLLRGFIYLMAVIDWHSRYVLSWSVSTTLDVSFCLDALNAALAEGKPEIFNSDQGSQFTSIEFTDRLKAASVQISMDGRGRALDNIFIERLWRSVKYEEVYLNDYATVPEAVQRLGRYLRFYNHERPHQSLNYRTPAAVYVGL